MQNAGMPSITIRDVPDDARDALAARAKSRGQSLQQFLRTELIKLAERRDNAAIIAEARQLILESGPGLTTEQIVEWQREDRGSDRL